MQKDLVSKLTQKQRYWLDQIERANSSGLSLGVYAKANDLNLQHLYQYKHLLCKKGLLGKPVKAPAFDRVQLQPLPINTQTGTALLSVYFPNGLRLEFPAVLNADVISLFVNQIARYDAASR